MTANVDVKASSSRPVRPKHECRALVRWETEGFLGFTCSGLTLRI